MHSIKEYINETIGIEVIIHDLDSKYLSQIPVYLRATYQWFELTMLGRKFLVAFINDDNEFSITAIDKQLSIIEDKLGFPVILSISQLEPYNRQRLVKMRRSFIVVGKQMYVPNLFIDLKEYNFVKKAQKAEHFLPLSQVMVLFYILNRNKTLQIDHKPFKEIADFFKVNTINVSRAIENLQQLELINVINKGRSKAFHFLDSEKELWIKALEKGYFISPIQKVVYSNRSRYVAHLPFAGDTALAEYTEINPSKQVTRAMDQESFSYLKKNTDLEFFDYEDEFIYQIWKYDPDIISKVTGEYNNKVDPLSLYLSYIDNIDERVEIELDKLIETIW